MRLRKRRSATRAWFSWRRGSTCPCAKSCASGQRINARCRELREADSEAARCEFCGDARVERLALRLSLRIHDIEESNALRRRLRACPNYAARRALKAEAACTRR